ncbi:MAG: leucine-rich repeat protein [Candidatus Lokiarchaeota archaeon]|nr:leucine-rich repeat protein [Candidatus Lokiarchaeota archaeon]
MQKELRTIRNLIFLTFLDFSALQKKTNLSKVGEYKTEHKKIIWEAKYMPDNEYTNLVEDEAENIREINKFSKYGYKLTECEILFEKTKNDYGNNLWVHHQGYTSSKGHVTGIGLGNIKHGKRISYSMGLFNSLRSRNIKKLFVLLSQFPKLEILDLSGLKIRLAQDIEKLTNLKVLNLSTRFFHYKKNISPVNFPVGVLELPNLEELHIVAADRLLTLPDSVAKLKKLTRIALSNSVLKTFPNWLPKLPNLSHLDLDGMELDKIPDCIFDLPNLEYLDLSNNNIKFIPNDILNLKKLKVLILSKNILDNLPEGIRELQNLEILDLTSNSFEEVPASLANLKNIKLIQMQQNPLKDQIACKIFQSANFHTDSALKYLKEIEDIQEEEQIKKQDKIEKKTSDGLNLSDSKILSEIEQLINKEIPKRSREDWTSVLDNGEVHKTKHRFGYFTENKKIVGLSLRNSKLTSIPTKVFQLENLRELDIGDNDLDKLSDKIENLVNLERLDISSTHLIYLTKSFGNLKNLKVINFLDVHDSQDWSRSIPARLKQVDSIEEFYYAGENGEELVKFSDFSDILKPEEAAALSKIEHYGFKLLKERSDINYLNYEDNLRPRHVFMVENGNVISLDISDTRFERLPDEIGKFTRLEILNVQSCYLQELPESIENLKNLKYLFLKNNSLATFPKSFGELEKLEFLEISSMKRSPKVIPEFFGNLSNLRVFKNTSSKIRKLPQSIGNLKNLQILELQGVFQQGLKEIPATLGELTGLKKLNLKQNEIRQLHEDVFSKMNKLESLILTNNNLKTLPKSIGELTSLKKIEVYGNHLETIPSTIGNLHSLEDLDIHFNKITEIPKEICNLTEVKEINISANKIESLPDAIGLLQNLEILDFASNNISNIPDSISNLKNLRVLNASENLLDNLPGGLLECPKLEEIHYSARNRFISTSELERSERFFICKEGEARFLDANEARAMKDLENLINKKVPIVPGITTLKVDPTLGNEYWVKNFGFTLEEGYITALNLKSSSLSRLPDTISLLKHLNELHLYDNVFEQIPESVSDLKSLKYIYLSDNDIKSIPKSFFNLSKLKILEINNNKLSEIPSEIENLTQLIELHLKGNKLVSLPNSISKLTQLTELDLSENQLVKLPEGFGELKNIEKLDLSKNEFKYLPYEIWPLKKLLPKPKSEMNPTLMQLKPEAYLEENQKFKFDDNRLVDINERELLEGDKSVLLEYCRKRATIHVFISHAVVNESEYKVRELSNYLESQHEIYDAVFCEEDLVGNIDEFMKKNVPKSNLLIFIATKESITSKDCQFELKLARNNNIEVIPILGKGLKWSDLNELGLSRELGFEFSEDNFDDLCESLYGYIQQFKRQINLFDNKEDKTGRRILKFRRGFDQILKNAEFKEILTNKTEECDNLILSFISEEINFREFLKKFISL